MSEDDRRPSVRLRYRLFHLGMLFLRPMTLGVRAAAFDADGRIFLVRHTYLPGWHLPGGGVDSGETVRQALEKELREEGNLRLGPPPDLFAIYKNTRSSPRDHVVLHVCRDVVQDAPFRGNAEIAEAAFFARDALPAATTPATRRRLAEIDGDVAVDPFW